MSLVSGVLERVSARRVVSCYFALQALAVAGWWLLLVLVPGVRPLFFPERLTGAPLMSFWLADLTLLVAGSAVTSWLVSTCHAAASAGAWFVAGAMYYPALYCLVVSLGIGGGELGVGAMFASAGMTLAMATVIGPQGEPAGFRACPSRDRRWIALKTVLQIVVFWGTFLGVFPYVIAHLQADLGLPLFTFPGRVTLGLIGFALAGTLGLWSAWVTVRIGGGTPLPTDCAATLVVTGPYHYVRNPMALAGITQGLFVALAWGSWLAGLYAVAGGFAWHLLAKPVEERDLELRFGEPYNAYRSCVRCWIPVFSRRYPQ